MEGKYPPAQQEKEPSAATTNPLRHQNDAHIRADKNNNDNDNDNEWQFVEVLPKPNNGAKKPVKPEKPKVGTTNPDKKKKRVTQIEGKEEEDNYCKELFSLRNILPTFQADNTDNNNADEEDNNSAYKPIIEENPKIQRAITSAALKTSLKTITEAEEDEEADANKEEGENPQCLIL